MLTSSQFYMRPRFKGLCSQGFRVDCRSRSNAISLNASVDLLRRADTLHIRAEFVHSLDPFLIRI
jgi:hypothetical protein